MALPSTMKVLGLGVGICVIVMVALLTQASVEMLLRFSSAANATSYGDAFGRVGKAVFQICILVSHCLHDYVMCCLGLLQVEEFIILEYWKGGLLNIGGLRFFEMHICFSGYLVITAGITTVKFFYGSIEMPRLVPKVTDMASVWKLFTVVPVLVIAFICHFNVHTIANELQNPDSIQPVVRTSLILCSAVYIMTSFFGFLLFGDSTLDDVLANFGTDLGIPCSFLLSDVVRISYALHLMLVFPIIFHPLRINFNDLFFPSSGPLELANRRFALTTIGLISIVFLGADFIPSILNVFQFTGATATVCIGFIFPAGIVLMDRHDIATTKDKYRSVFMIGLAVFSNLIAIYTDAATLLKRNMSPLQWLYIV